MENFTKLRYFQKIKIHPQNWSLKLFTLSADLKSNREQEHRQFKLKLLAVRIG